MKTKKTQHGGGTSVSISHRLTFLARAHKVFNETISIVVYLVIIYFFLCYFLSGAPLCSALPTTLWDLVAAYAAPTVESVTVCCRSRLDTRSLVFILRCLLVLFFFFVCFFFFLSILLHPSLLYISVVWFVIICRVRTRDDEEFTFPCVTWVDPSSQIPFSSAHEFSYATLFRPREHGPTIDFPCLVVCARVRRI